jgi:hypothetical protein
MRREEIKIVSYRWLDTIENDMKAVGVFVGDVKNRDEWMIKIKVTDPK